MMPEHEQFGLLRFTTKKDLSRIVQSFCKLTSLSGGVVAVPEDPANPPTQEDDFRRYRLTEPETINQYPLCGFVRSCSEGNLRCMWSDLAESSEAATRGTALPYRCHLGLVDIVAPIKVAGRHIANVYLGEIRPPDLDFEKVWAHYQDLTSKSNAPRTSASKSELKEEFQRLPMYSEERIASFVESANVLAELISQRATRQAAVVIALDAAHEVGATLNLYSSLSIYLKHALRLLNGKTGSIFLLNDGKDRLTSFAYEWGESHEVELSMSVNGPGLIATCARENVRRYHGDLKEQYDTASKGRTRAYIIRRGSREEIEQETPAALGWTRDRRELRSILVVPITCGPELLGVLELGSSVQNAYTEDDEHVLRLFAREIGLYVRSSRERQSLLRVFGENDSVELGRVLAREIPLHVEGLGCSIFLRHGSEARLFATNEFPPNVREDITYQLGEGFTGWILKRGKPLRIPAGPKCRTDNLPPELREQGVVWRGKYADKDRVPSVYWEDRPYLGVPVRRTDGEVCGVIRISDRKSGSFSEYDQTILQSFADCLGQLLKAPNLAGRRTLDKKPKHVFLGYGRNLDARGSLKAFLETLGIVVESYDDWKRPGDYPYNILMQCIENSDAAIVLYMGDDELQSGERIARRNVAYELGVAHRTFGPKGTLLLMEEGVEEPTNIRGMQVVLFGRGCLAAKFGEIRDILRSMAILQ